MTKERGVPRMTPTSWMKNNEKRKCENDLIWHSKNFALNLKKLLPITMKRFKLIYPFVNLVLKAMYIEKWFSFNLQLTA